MYTIKKRLAGLGKRTGMVAIGVTLGAVAAASPWHGSAQVSGRTDGHADRCAVPTAIESRPERFEGTKLLALSDATMPASAFMDGKLTPGGRDAGGDQDTLTTLGLPMEIGVPRDPAPAGAPIDIGETFVDNSAIGPPYGISTSPNGNIAYVLSTRGNPPAGTTEVANVFRDFPTRALMSTVDTSDVNNPRVIQTLEVGRFAHTAQVSPDGSLLALNTDEPGRNIVLRRVQPNGLIGEEVLALSGANTGEAVRRVGRVEWHPSGQFLAHGIPFEDEIRFYRVDRSGQDVNLSQWGDPVRVGKFPDEGIFTKDGGYYLTTDLQWGDDVPGLFHDSPPGTITAVRFDSKHGRHRVTGQAPTDVSPEGVAVSPDGRYVVTANLTRSWHPWDSPRLTPEGSLNLLELDGRSGRLKTIQRLPVDGILVEGLAFDASGDNIAVTVFDRFDPRKRRGAVEFYHLARNNKRGCDTASIVNTNVELEVPAGPHSLWLVR